MIRRVLRRIVVGSCLLSLLACGAASWLWQRSYHERDQVSFRAFDARYTVRSEGGLIALRGPPAIRSRAEAIYIAPRMATIRNEHIRFFYDPPSVPFYPDSDATNDRLYFHFFAEAGDGTYEHDLFDRSPTPELARFLLDALDIPGQFIAAHILLSHQPENVKIDPRLDRFDSTGFTIRGLQVQWESNPGTGRMYQLFNGTDGSVTGTTTGTPHIDPAQLSAIREYWHIRYDISHLSLRHWQIMTILLVPSVLWAVHGLRHRLLRHRRGRLGLCLVCGYDLRGSVGRCSECGEPRTL